MVDADCGRWVVGGLAADDAGYTAARGVAIPDGWLMPMVDGLLVALLLVLLVDVLHIV